MLIGVDASRTTVSRRTGTEAYALNLIRALLAAGPADGKDQHRRWRLYFRESPTPDLLPHSEHIEHKIIRLPMLWTHLGLAAEIARRPPELLFIPAHVRPLWLKAPAVVTVHDLGYLHFPESHPRRQRAYLDLSTKHSARHCQHLIADSQATRADLIKHYRVPPQNVTVIYPGFDPHPFVGEFQRPAGLPAEYLLYVGTIQPRKGLLQLLAAFSNVPEAPTLLLVGNPGWLSAPIYQSVQELKLEGRVRFLGYVPDSELPALYRHAHAFVFPSLYEGFGFPILEAFASGTPVLCSDGGSLPEVAGEAALIVPAGEVDALSNGLQHLLSNRAVRAGLVERGHEQLKKFSWEKAAAETLLLFESVL